MDMGNTTLIIVPWSQKAYIGLPYLVKCHAESFFATPQIPGACGDISDVVLVFSLLIRKLLRDDDV